MVGGASKAAVKHSDRRQDMRVTGSLTAVVLVRHNAGVPCVDGSISIGGARLVTRRTGHLGRSASQPSVSV